MIVPPCPKVPRRLKPRSNNCPTFIGIWDQLVLVVTHGKYMHYKTNFTTPVSLSHALDIVSLMSEFMTLWLWKQWTISFNSLWNIDLKPCFELLLGYDWLQKKDLYCAVLGSVFLASHGGSRPSVPPFLYYTLRKPCCTNLSQEYSNVGKCDARPRRRQAPVLAMGQPAKGAKGLEEEFYLKSKELLAGDRASWYRFLMYLANDFMPAYLSVTPCVPCLAIKRKNGVKKKQLIPIHINWWYQRAIPDNVVMLQCCKLRWEWGHLAFDS